MRCINGVRIACWNVGGLAARYHDILALRRTHGVDIVCCQEIGQVDPVLFLSLRQIKGFQFARLFYCARKGGRGGGVAFIVLNPSLRASEAGRLPRGGLTLRVSADNFEPFVIFNAYFPPAGSPHREDGEYLRAWLPYETARLRETAGIRSFLYAADWNDRQGSKNRYTADSHAASSRLTALQDALDASPALGRTNGVMAATMTSRSPQSNRRNPRELSEVDGFWCSRSLPANKLGALHPDERHKRSDFFRADGDSGGPRLPGDLTHLPVVLDFQPEAYSPPVPLAPRQRVPRLRASYTPVYVDPSWAKRAEANTQKLAGVSGLAADMDTTLETIYAAIRDGTLEAATDVHPYHEHAPTAKHRLFQNSSMPTYGEFVDKSEQARRMWAKGSRLLQRARHSELLDTSKRRRLVVKGEQLREAAEELRVPANSKAANNHKRWRAQLSHAFQSARRIDPHALWTLAFAELTLADPLAFESSNAIPQADGGPTPLVNFHRYFRLLSRERRLKLAPGASRYRQFWRTHIPEAPDDQTLTAVVPTELIYCLVFPATKRLPPARCGPHPCAACDRQAAEWAAWKPRDDPHNIVPPPTFKPSLRASRAAGPDGLTCEDWRWARPDDLDDRFDYRWQLSGHLAAFVNRVILEGRVPDGDFAQCVSVPVFKDGKPGQPKPDRALGNNYRDITISNLLAKLVSLVLTFRLTHWALRHHMISPEQVAFMPYHSAESHVFVFTQLLRSRARQGGSTRVLFVDLHKAYNRVHLASLWHLLREMGVPELIVRLLDDWATKRRTRLRVNGELSPEYPMLAGTPQGDPLSCLLFNLFIEPLIRYINSLPSIRGINIPGTDRTVKSLFFADDIAGLSALESDDSQRTMDAVMRWCRDWFMEASTGTGKTETVTYRANGGPCPPPPAVVYATVPADTDSEENPGGVVWGPWQVTAAAVAEANNDADDDEPPSDAAPIAINESDGYRYLGWRSKADISDTLATANLIKTMDMLYYRYFTFNLTIRRCSPTLQLQLLHCNVIGPVVYLLSMLSVNSAMQDKFDRRMRRYARPIFGLMRSTPNSTVTAITRINSFRALQGRERARLMLQLACPLVSGKSIAYDVLNGISGGAPGRQLSHINLPAYHARGLAKLERLGVTPPPASLPHFRVTTESGLHGDRIALQQWQHEARIASRVIDPPRTTRTRRGSAALAPLNAFRFPRPLPLEHAADLYFDFSQPIGDGPVKHGLAPLSYLGPSGTSILALSNLQRFSVSVVARLHSGNTALRRHPWRPRNPMRPELHKDSVHATEVEEPRTGSGVHGADDELSDTDTEASADSDEDMAAGGHGTDSSFSSDSDTTHNSQRRTRRRTGDSAVAAAPLALACPASRRRLQAPDDPRAAFEACRFCGSGHEHPYHAFFECSAGRLPGLRAALLADAPIVWNRLLERVRQAVAGRDEDITDAIATQFESAAHALAAVFECPSGTEARWLTYRLLWAIPWAARDVPLDATAAREIGTIFDTTILSRHASRPLADSWVASSFKWVNLFGAAWVELLAKATCAAGT